MKALVIFIEKKQKQLTSFKFSLSKGGTLMKKVFYRSSENTDILRGGHRKPYQLENAIKSGGIVFCIYHLG